MGLWETIETSNNQSCSFSMEEVKNTLIPFIIIFKTFGQILKIEITMSYPKTLKHFLNIWKVKVKKENKCL